MRLSVFGACCAMATSAKSRSGAPSLPQPRRSGGFGFRPLVLKSMTKLGSWGVVELRERLHVLSRAEHESSRWVESVCVDEDQSEPPHQIRVLERRQRRIGLGHEQRIAGRQGGNELRIDGEVVALDVTRPAGPSVAIERLVQEEPAALGDELRKIGCSRGGGRGIEPERRRRVIDEADLPAQETMRTTCWDPSARTRQRALARPDHERAIREEAGEGRRAPGSPRACALPDTTA